MRTWGRVTDQNGNQKWVAVESDASGDFSYGWVTTLIQTLKLGLGESPFYAQYGIPTQQSIVQQIYPDYYVNITQQQFAGYFASLSVSKVESAANPTYDIKAVFFSGVTYQAQIAV
ncbi:hypothetical protein FO131_19540 [Salmonella bongori]|uniref:hypothetical protein n=1 Tax=Salmonella bongori TaxID=54736 RepID=UPI001277EE2E|nr:hypothetical protein [Salmonella bongori]ECG8259008.1 hypothetical protein [Salmonella bongori serovar 48:i:-]ECG9254702.1 hypothetical protein [Salmonella bongori]EDP8708168.1 hypothetical protein [Salmonella bongori]EDP8725788.1 hypothetical protein [Salmonella bongori]EEO9371544.1 hypothetical protein [Salmonella bongori]